MSKPYDPYGPGRACASHFKVLNPLDKIVVARGDDPVVPAIQRGRQVFPNCCHPRVSDKMKPTPSNVQYTTEAYWVYKHAWRGVGAYYQKGDHIQKKKTGNAPIEFKALKMFSRLGTLDYSKAYIFCQTNCSRRLRPWKNREKPKIV